MVHCGQRNAKKLSTWTLSNVKMRGKVGDCLCKVVLFYR